MKQQVYGKLCVECKHYETYPLSIRTESLHGLLVLTNLPFTLKKINNKLKQEMCLLDRDALLLNIVQM